MARSARCPPVQPARTAQMPGMAPKKPSLSRLKPRSVTRYVGKKVMKK
jgi:hypothetical protein